MLFGIVSDIVPRGPGSLRRFSASVGKTLRSSSSFARNDKVCDQNTESTNGVQEKRVTENGVHENGVTKLQVRLDAMGTSLEKFKKKLVFASRIPPRPLII